MTLAGIACPYGYYPQIRPLVLMFDFPKKHNSLQIIETWPFEGLCEPRPTVHFKRKVNSQMELREELHFKASS